MHLVEEPFWLGTCKSKTATGIPSFSRQWWAVLQCLPLLLIVHTRLNLLHVIAGSSMMRGLSSCSILSNPGTAFEASCASCAVPHVYVIVPVGLPENVRRIRQPRLWLTLCACMPAHPAARAYFYPRACTGPAHLFHGCHSWIESRDYRHRGSPAVSRGRAPQLPLSCECGIVTVS